MEEIKAYPIELDKTVFRALLNYCGENDISTNDFIKSNLEAIGEY